MTQSVLNNSYGLGVNVSYCNTVQEINRKVTDLNRAISEMWIEREVDKDWQTTLLDLEMGWMGGDGSSSSGVAYDHKGITRSSVSCSQFIHR